MRLLLSILLFSSTASAKEYKFTGHAYKTDKKEVKAYTEKHTLKLENAKVLNSKTEYFNTDGKKIAELTCDYTKGQILPSFEFIDYRDGYWENLTYVDEQNVKVSYKKNKEAKEKSESMSKSEYLSASQGLNEFIKKNLSNLYNGKEVITSFVIPARLGDIDMLVRGKPKGDDQVHVSIDVKNILLRIFAPSIRMTYAKETGNLLRYWGNSNISDQNGDSQKVYIEYDYPNLIKVASNE